MVPNLAIKKINNTEITNIIGINHIYGLIQVNNEN